MKAINFRPTTVRCSLLALVAGSIWLTSQRRSSDSESFRVAPIASPTSEPTATKQVATEPSSDASRLQKHVPSWVTSGEPVAVEPLPADLDIRKFSKAQDGEDVFSYETFFWQKQNGVVLESGALNGLQFSVSHSFEHALGWRAILVEAGPTNYQQLLKHRPNALSFHTALCDKTETVHFVEPLKYESRSSVAGIVEFMHPSHLARWWPDLDRKNLDADPRITKISCQPLQPLLHEAGIAHVDLWVLDVEGAELTVLKTLDFTKTIVDVIVIELDGKNQSKDRAVRKYLEQSGYEARSAPGHTLNTWFVRKAAKASLSSKPKK